MRVTIDRDFNSWLDMCLTLLRGFWHIGCGPDYLRKSSSGRGYHYVWHDVVNPRTGLGEWGYVMCLRRKIGDDPNRLRHDEQKNDGHFRQVLFTKKKVVIRDGNGRFKKHG